MTSELPPKLLGVLAITLPWIALAVAGADTGALVGVGALAATLAISMALAPLRRATSAISELDDALDHLEVEVTRVREAWETKVTRAQTAGRFRDEFVAAVRHELRTPLNAILGFADVLLEEVDGPLDPRQREDVEAIRSAGGYLQELVQAVLSEWSPRRGTPLPLGYVELEALFGQVARMLEGQARGRGVELRVEVPAGLVGPLADERRLRQILVNLGTNALRATERGTVTFSAEDEGEHVRLTVRDTGAGIDPDALSTLFAPFTQAGSRDARDGGSGMGLALVREMAEWHGGYLEVETHLGEGSAFSVVLRKSVG